MKENFGLTRTVSCSEAAYDTLGRASALTGLPMGQLVSALVEKHLNPRNSLAARDAMSAAREAFSHVLD